MLSLVVFSFIILSWFFKSVCFLLFLFLLAAPHGLQGLGFLGLGLNLWGKNTKSKMLDDREFPAPRNINWCELVWRSPSQTKTWLNQTAPRLQCSTPHTKQPVRQGMQPHLIADRLPKVILSLQTPQSLPPDTALLIRDSRLNSIHQSTVPPIRKPTQGLGPASPTRGQTLEERGTRILPPAKRKSQTQ